MPSYKSIENVLNFLWGKGTKIEIHTNTINRTMLVRIPNEFIRKKVVEKRIWYVGTAMFHVAEWSSSQTTETPDLASIPIWAHLKGVPFDLRHQEGLSYAAGLVGEPKETDDYTKNLTNIGIAHVKVEADLTQPLPTVVELKRQNGEIIPVEVQYPWTPPSCSHCHQIGHIFKDCLTANPKWVPTDPKASDKEELSKTNNQPDPPTYSPSFSSYTPSSSSPWTCYFQIPNLPSNKYYSRPSRPFPSNPYLPNPCFLHLKPLPPNHSPTWACSKYQVIFPIFYCCSFRV